MLSRCWSMLIVSLVVSVGGPATFAAGGSDSGRLHVLMLGDGGHHRPAQRLVDIAPYLLHRGIDLVYTDDIDDLNAVSLARYDALLLYANIDTISDDHARALLDYVAGGGGFVPVHCASYCFRNNPKIVALIGGQFKSHETGTFRTKIIAPDHPVMRDFAGFESWDETYIHTLHNPQHRTVLSERDGEPYTWVRTHGKGRVFYTAWGHDQRTFTNPGFRELLERGIRWACGDDSPAATITRRPVLEPFEYVKTDKVPYYPPGGDRSGTGVWNLMPKPLSPAESMKHAITPAGFDLKLFACDPQIKKPVCMAWDDRGRLWVAETIDYPNRIAPDEGRDRITICEDTDHDGIADKFTVFAEGLNIPTSMCFANGGLIVLQAPDTLYFQDIDNDDVADVRRVLFTGWSKHDTHAGPSNLRYGLDNWIYGTVGYAGFNGVVGGEHHKFSMGIYRFKPDGSKLEYLRATNNNTWGLGQSEDGLIFASTANNNPSNHLPIANRYYQRVADFKAAALRPIADSSRFLPITDKVRQVDVHGGYTSGASHSIYTARAYPRAYWNSTAFVNGPTGHLLGVFRLMRHGTAVSSHNPFNLVVGDDEWFAPIIAEVGPDGAVWFLDWYNYIVQHNPTPKGRETGPGNAYINDLRDKRHGRVYRVVYKDAPQYKPHDLTRSTPQQLVNTLVDTNMLWRLHAQRLLVQRGLPDVASSLISLVQDTSVDEVGLNTGAIHALWTLHGLHLIDEAHPMVLAVAFGALRHPSPGVRRNALQVLPSSAATVDAILKAGSLNDDDAQVRLAALLALSECPSSTIAGASIFGMIAESRNFQDAWLPDAATIAGARHSAGFLAAADSARKAAPHDDQPKVGPNLMPNASFEEIQNGQPVAWKVRNYNGPADHAIVEAGRTGDHCLKISSSVGSDTSWFVDVPVTPGALYRLSGWVKTDSVKGARGGLFNVHGLKDGVTDAISGSQDWTRVQREFRNDSRTRFSINCLFGGWGKSTGTVWYDDVSLVMVHELPTEPLQRVIRRVAADAEARQSGAIAGAARSGKPLDQGGDPARGRAIFFKNELVGCVRCHKVANEGGDVGPDLSDIAKRTDRAYILESLIDPNAKIAESYKQSPISPMPPMQLLISDDEIRDLVAFLSTLK
ncbi:c-type cytochrome [Planctomycetales bacterium ZRK34]|nr:c-type cytochrome [Planctomycetales bacterium ZRK34]